MPKWDPQDISVKKMKELFRRYDDDKDGTIDKHSLRQILTALSPGMTSREFEKIFHAIDENHDGKIQYDEFVDLIFLDGATDGVAPNPKSKSKRKGRVNFPIGPAKAVWTVWQLMSNETQPGSKVPKDVVIESLRIGSWVQKSARTFMDGDGTEEEQGKLFTRLTSSDTRSRIDDAPDEIDSETFVRIVWPKIKESDLSTVLKLMRRFLAQYLLSEVVRAVVLGEKTDIEPADIKFLFEEIDVDDDEEISVKEMVKVGALKATDAIALSEKLDTLGLNDGTISMEELMAVVCKGIRTEFGESMRALFAGSM
eukprot:TRINITY_DN32395_c0_g1_i1.p1 TRINITY_DN32395_c0_g1~~TRINITY_DN32395_c0_g1_i1.p1  ORF type:complete len:311 (+),score=62.60 TRINITY_DN32395_c0_g1_i1:97-1029(+)